MQSIESFYNLQPNPTQLVLLSTRTSRHQQRPPAVYDILLMPKDEPLLDHKVFVLVISVHARLGSSEPPLGLSERLVRIRTWARQICQASWIFLGKGFEPWA
ncbi:hypothetical protein LZ31DRAFT_268039 [Colletotrichum somersetense]|nr:hypothetical protein LZ31DRAFT_268039 [Colletotrichum somersetense]